MATMNNVNLHAKRVACKQQAVDKVTLGCARHSAMAPTAGSGCAFGKQGGRARDGRGDAGCVTRGQIAIHAGCFTRGSGMKHVRQAAGLGCRTGGTTVTTKFADVCCLNCPAMLVGVGNLRGRDSGCGQWHAKLRRMIYSDGLHRQQYQQRGQQKSGEFYTHQLIVQAA